MWVMETKLRPELEARRPAKVQQLMKTMWTMVGIGELGGKHRVVVARH